MFKDTRKNKRKTNIGRPKKFSVRDRRLLKRSIDQLRQVNANFTMKEPIRFSDKDFNVQAHLMARI